MRDITTNNEESQNKNEKTTPDGVANSVRNSSISLPECAKTKIWLGRRVQMRTPYYQTLK